MDSHKSYENSSPILRHSSNSYISNSLTQGTFWPLACLTRSRAVVSAAVDFLLGGNGKGQLTQSKSNFCRDLTCLSSRRSGAKLASRTVDAWGKRNQIRWRVNEK